MGLFFRKRFLNYVKPPWKIGKKIYTTINFYENIFTRGVSFTALTNETLQLLLSAFHLVFVVAENSSKKKINSNQDVFTFVRICASSLNCDIQLNRRKVLMIQEKHMITRTKSWSPSWTKESCYKAYLEPYQTSTIERLLASNLVRKITSIVEDCHLAGNCMFKFNNRNIGTRCEICSKLTIKTPERQHWSRSGVFIVNFEYISHLVVLFLLLTLSW